MMENTKQWLYSIFSEGGRVGIDQLHTRLKWFSVKIHDPVGKLFRLC